MNHIVLAATYYFLDLSTPRIVILCLEACISVLLTPCHERSREINSLFIDLWLLNYETFLLLSK